MKLLCENMHFWSIYPVAVLQFSTRGSPDRRAHPRVAAGGGGGGSGSGASGDAAAGPAPAARGRRPLLRTRPLRSRPSDGPSPYSVVAGYPQPPHPHPAAAETPRHAGSLSPTHGSGGGGASPGSGAPVGAAFFDPGGGWRPPPGSVLIENALLDAYSWHGLKRLYGCGLLFLVLFMAVWYQTEPGATAFKSSVINSFASYDSGQPWELTTLDSADSTSDAFDYVLGYLSSVIRRSGEVLPEAGSFVYLGDFAHITYAQLQIKFHTDCPNRSASGSRRPRGTGGRPSLREEIRSLRAASAPLASSPWWPRYTAGGAARPGLEPLPDTVQMARPRPPWNTNTEAGGGTGSSNSSSSGPRRSEAAGATSGGGGGGAAVGLQSVPSGVFSEQLLGLSDTCVNLSRRVLPVDAAAVNLSDNIRNVLAAQRHYSRLSNFSVDYLSFLDLVGRLERRPVWTQGIAGGGDDDDSDDYYTEEASAGNATSGDDKLCTAGYVRRCLPSPSPADPSSSSSSSSASASASASSSASSSAASSSAAVSSAGADCFCAHGSTGLPRTLRAYMDPADPRDGTALVELVRLWPDFVGRVSLNDMQYLQAA
ncbi:hypothetical protein GPECTOR_54g221 [Gonium pectorale]|uniref:Uncharacterized protein n=1 Tax=Gonium pectorale TaxID=33097 RepID=A0A150G802_GONPE|nr:hypothetical protein GPECTOR_54g221 [Gonium pectorale]|eukprot:KXZ45480.1 hypothetical protein GPECTOR_54g221 [Gonium pectorale]